MPAMFEIRNMEIQAILELGYRTIFQFGNTKMQAMLKIQNAKMQAIFCWKT